MSRPPLTLELPTVAADHPRWARASVLAIVGFSLGVLVPKIFDVKLGPNPPSDGRSNVHVATASAKPGTLTAPGIVSPLEVHGGGAAAGGHEARIEIGEGQITACRDANGKGQKTCEPLPTLDAALADPLRGLTKCPSAMGLSGKLSIGFDVDFKKKTIKPQRGKSTTLPTSTVEGMLKCLEKPLATLSLDGLGGELSKLTVFYQVAFVPPKAPDAPTPEPAAAAATVAPAPSGSGSPGEAPAAPEAEELKIAWKSVTFRDAPRTGTPVGKLSRGTKIVVLGNKGDWLHVRAMPSRQEGWVIKGATEK
jgi:hypothetical protein